MHASLPQSDALPNDAPPRQGWLESHTETVLDPDLEIVDPHHHLWDRPGHRYLFHDFLADIDCGHNIVATVAVESRAMHRASGPPEFRTLGEVEFLRGAAAMSLSGRYGPAQICAGIVPYLDLTLGARVDAALESVLSIGGERVKGVRQPAAWSADAGVQASAPAGLFESGAFRLGFSALAKAKLHFEVWAYQNQIPEIVSLADAFPDTTLVVNHLAGPLATDGGNSREAFDQWSTGISALSRRDNVVMKLGGLGMRSGPFEHHQARVPVLSVELAAAWGPYVEHSIDCFSPARCMFESNFPVDKATCSYVTLWNAFKRIGTKFDRDEQEMLFSGTAISVYRLTLK